MQPGRGAACFSEAVDARRCRRLLLLVPTFVGHFPEALTLFRSLLSQVSDLNAASLRFVLADIDEVGQLRSQMRGAPPVCSNASGPLDVGFVHVDEIMDAAGISCSKLRAQGDDAVRRSFIFWRFCVPGDPPTLWDGGGRDGRGKDMWRTASTRPKNASVCAAHERAYRMLRPNISSASCGLPLWDVRDEMHRTYWKFQYQFLKKMYAARYFEAYHTVLVMDSETIFLKPTSLEALFADYARTPLVLLSSHTKSVRFAFRGCLDILLESDNGTIVGEYLKARKLDGESALVPPVGPKAPTHPYLAGRIVSELMYKSAPEPLASQSPYLGLWGQNGWFWQRGTLHRIFRRVERLHGCPLLEQHLRMASALAINPGERKATAGACHEASLYWLFALLTSGNRGDVPVSEPSETLGSSDELQHYFVSPKAMLARYWPQTTARGTLFYSDDFEFSTLVLLLANTTEPFRGWLQMCREWNISFFRLPNTNRLSQTLRLPPDINWNLEIDGPRKLPAHRASSALASWNGDHFRVSRDLTWEVYDFDAYFLQLACMVSL